MEGAGKLESFPLQTEEEAKPERMKGKVHGTEHFSVLIRFCCFLTPVCILPISALTHFNSWVSP